ncbi:hypothetical protein HPB48_016137 [Haemaphysalis longicornis]|uniref:Uncharacterized protein n=1 Tax=Haemaphysalis longicornis TaxID=44386 RepID=A0A9J6FQP3_HAELO|nr:hypothetical protein HPB48_016137 [Haemaphysalis longicornis]
MRPFGWLSPKGFTLLDIETSEGFECEEVFGSGQFQNLLALFVVFALWVTQCHTLAFSLISADVDHWCSQPMHVNLSASDWKRIAIPVEADGRHSRCTVYTNLSDPNDQEVVGCDAWDYAPERANSSIVSEWNLVCGRRLLKTLATPIYSAGAMVFLVTSGYCADRFGRRPVIVGCASGVMVATLGCCFAKSYPLYLCTRFISGGALPLYAVAIVILLESCSFARRPASLSFCMLMGLMVSKSHFTILKLMPHLNWFLLQLFMIAPAFFLPFSLFLVVESPRWLIASRRLEAAGRVMLSAAKSNDAHHDCVALLLQRVRQRLLAEESKGATPTVATDMTRIVRRRAIIMFGSTFSVMMAYYSLLLFHAERRTSAPWAKLTSLGGYALAYCLLLKLVNRMDKTRLITGAFVILGSCCCLQSIGTVIAPSESPLHAIGDVTLELTLTACCVALVFNLVYVAELFPTPFRGTALCFMLAGGRLGATLGALLKALEGIGREDLLFALIGTVVFSSAYSFRYLPLKYGTYARLADPEESITCAVNDLRRSVSTVDEMKQSLDSLSHVRKGTKKHRRHKAHKRSLANVTSP